MFSSGSSGRHGPSGLRSQKRAAPAEAAVYIRRYGLYASRSRGTWSRKPHLVRLAGPAWRVAHPGASPGDEPALQSQEVERKTASSTWARLIAKVYEVDPLQCAQCGSPMKVLAVIMDPVELDKILAHPIKTGWAPPIALAAK